MDMPAAIEVGSALVQVQAAVFKGVLLTPHENEDESLDLVLLRHSKRRLFGEEILGE